MAQNSPRLLEHLATGLSAVRTELDHAISRARLNIERYAEMGDDHRALEQAADELLLIRGTASIIQCFGISALAEEMHQCVRDIMQGKLDGEGPAMPVLMSAVVQVSDYIDALSSGHHDSVLVLQPIINELRLARGKPVLTELDLFVAQMHALGLELRPPESNLTAAADVKAMAVRMLPVYQAALLACLKGIDVQQNLMRIGKVAEQLVSVSTDSRIYQTWRVVAALVEAVLTRALPDGVEVKRLLGQAGQQLRQIAEGGEAQAAMSSPELAYQMLFVLGRSPAKGSRAQKLIEFFHLRVNLPPTESLDRLRQRLRGPGTGLMLQVADEIRRDLSAVKDKVDLIVRTGPRQPDDLATAAAQLTHVAGTLNVLGLAPLERLTHQQLKRLNHWAETGELLPNERMALATGLLHIESHLDELLFRQLRGPFGRGGSSQTERAIGAAPSAGDLREAISALHREALVNLARTKACYDSYLRDPDTASLRDAVRMCEELVSIYGMLPEDLGVDIGPMIESLSARAELGGKPEPQESALFADAVSALEFYIEALRIGSVPAQQGWRERLEPVLGRLAAEAALVVHAQEAQETPAAVSPDGGEAAEMPFEEITASETAPAVVNENPPPAVEPEPEEVDPVIREVFLEEATEVLERLQSQLPQWRRSPSERELLSDIRRSFHTLKGSGRMVGAVAIGEFAWAVENMLNRALDGTIAVGEAVAQLVTDAIGQLPGMIEGFRNADQKPADQDLIDRAQRLASGKDEEALEMLRIFQLDASERLELVREWLQSSRSAERAVVTSDVVRAFHTLRGAGYAVQAKAIGDLSAALETYLDALRALGSQLDEHILSEISACVAALTQWVRDAGEADKGRADAAPLLERVQKLRSHVPEAEVEAASDRQLTEIFCNEAFDLIQALEQGVAAWSRSPDATYLSSELLIPLHTLQGAAAMSGCQPLSDVAKAIYAGVAGRSSAEQPGPQWFDGLNQLVEELYQLLDLHRDSTLTQEIGQRALARVEPLLSEQAASVSPSAVPQSTPDVAPPQASPSVGFDVPPSFNEPVRSGTDSAPVPTVDPELLQIFTGETAELLQSIHSDLETLRQSPDNTAAAAELRRAMHTLRGGARMVEAELLAEVAYRQERMIEPVVEGRRPVDRDLIRKIELGAKGIAGALMLLEQDQAADPHKMAQVLAEALAATEDEAEGAALAQPPAFNVSEDIELAAPEDFQAIENELSFPAEDHLEVTLDGLSLDSDYPLEPAPQAPELSMQDLGPDTPAFEPGALSEPEVEDALPMLEVGEEPELTLADVAPELQSPVQAPVASTPDETTIEVSADDSLLAWDQPTEVAAEPEITLEAPQEAEADAFDPAIWEAQLRGGISVEEQPPQAEAPAELESEPEITLELDSSQFPEETLVRVDTEELPDGPYLQPGMGEAFPPELLDPGVSTLVQDEVPEEPLPTLEAAEPYAPTPDPDADQGAAPGWDEVSPVETAGFEAPPPEMEAAAESEPVLEPPFESPFGTPVDDVAPIEPFEAAAPEAPPVAVEPPFDAAPAAEPAPMAVVHAEEAELPQDFDPELAEIFTAEAGELLEMLESSLESWIESPSNMAAMREMQRALHTIKGGARMAGLTGLATASHDMETSVNTLESHPAARDVVAFSGLRGSLEAMQSMHDRMLAGDFMSVRMQTMASVPVVAEPGHGAPAAESAVPAAPAPSVAAAESQAPAQPVAPEGWAPLLFWQPEQDEQVIAARRETARVDVDLLDRMLNDAGEIAIYRARLEEQNRAMNHSLSELEQTVERVREQLRQMDIETEAQIAARGLQRTETEEEDRYGSEFDPLEMDRYSRMQELSRALAESVGDLASVHRSLDTLVESGESLLQQQSRTNTELQTGLMGTLMVPFSRQIQRQQRIVRQTAGEHSKLADIQFSGVEAELDRNVLERMTAPLEHLLRNCVIHGIETPDKRVAAGKPEQGLISLSLSREGTQLLIELRDDGRGLDFEAIRNTAINKGLMPADAVLSNDEIALFIFAPGFSTARTLTQDAGRGIGMDIVSSEVKQLGGTLEVGSETGKGTRFLIRLPLTLAISQSLLVRAAEEVYALPLSSIEGIARIRAGDLEAYVASEEPVFQYGGQFYTVRYLGELLELPPPNLKSARSVSLILVRVSESIGGTERRVAIAVDELVGNREVVSKAVGPQVSSVTGVTGATILADGRVVLILDIVALLLDRSRRAISAQLAEHARRAQVLAASPEIMVVDDSITMRRVAERLLTRNGYRVSTAKDGLDAMAALQTARPSAILLDIEMPRADGFEVAAFVRNQARIADTPIIMITSRSGDKHRERAESLGVNRYLIKPYQEDQLLAELKSVLGAQSSVER